MTIDEIRGRDDADLDVALENEQRRMFDLRFKGATGEVENPNEMREAKQNVARILTVLNERRLGIRGATPH